MSETQLPSHWKIVKLGDEKIAKTSSGGTPNRSKPEFFGGNILWVKSGELDDNWLYDTEEKITQQGLEKSSAKIFTSGTLLLALYGATAGKTAILGVEAATNQAVCAISPVDDSFDNQFLQFYLILIRSQILSARTGGAQPNISQRVIKLLDIILPPLPEQRAIAHTLRTIQKAKEARQRELELERERKATLMQHLFTYGTYNEPTKQTEIGEIPKSWLVVQLGNISEFLQYGTSQRCDSDSSGIPVLRIPNVIGGQIDVSDLKFINFSSKEAENLKLKVGDLLFVRTNGRREYTGRCAVFTGELKEALFASYLIRVRLKPNTLLPEFVQLYTMTPQGKGYLSGRASNAADGKFNINTQTIKSVLVPVPSSNEQHQIVTVLQACNTKIQALEKEISTLDELFRAMLSELMTGRLSTQPLIK